MSKKAQISLFIIIGIVIVLSVSIYLFARQSQTEAQIQQPMPTAPISKDAISSYVQKCVENSLATGLEIMSLQGGYIYIPAGTKTLDVRDPEGRTVVEENGKKKVVIGEGVNKVPYWVLKDRIDIPTPDFMIEELQRFVNEETALCVDGFKPFKEQGFSMKYWEINTTIRLDKVVFADVKFPIKATRGNETIEIEGFQTIAPIDLRKIGEVALNIAANEYYSAFLEDSTNNLISLYSGVEEDKLPPTAATITSSDCSFVRWDENSVKERLKRILQKGISYVKVEGTEFEEPTDNALKSFIYRDAMINASGITADFEYNPSWDLLNFDVKPNKGLGISGPDKIVSPVNMILTKRFCTFNYRYKYDVEYPVLLRIGDKSSSRIDTLSKKYVPGGYIMQIPLWTVIYGNEKRVFYGVPDYLSAGIGFNQTEIQETGYVETLFCDEKQKASGNVTIQTETEGDVLPEVDIYFVCGDDSNNNCFIGRTNQSGILQTKMPLCQNGVLKLSKQGFASSEKPLTTIKDQEQSLDYSLEKIRSIGSRVNAIRIIDLIRAYKSGDLSRAYSLSSPIIKGEQAMVNIIGATQINGIYPDISNEPIQISSGDYVLNYNLKANMVINPIFQIYNGQNIEGSLNPEGGVYSGVWVTGTGTIPFSITKDELEGKNEIVFIVLAAKRADEQSSAKDFEDSVINDTGDINAELLYQGENLIAVDGVNTKDFVALENQRVEYITILSEEYARYLKPVLI